MAYTPPHIKASHRGLLHEEMGIPKDKKISIGALMRKKASAKRSGNGAEVKRTTFAINARGWHHG